MAERRKRKNSQETQTIPHDILVTHIFPRLPAKTLVGFRCVCKQWLSLLQDPKMADLHSSFSHTRLPPKPSLIVAFTNKQSSNQSLYFTDENWKVNPNTPLSTPEYQCVSQIVNGYICLINPDLVTICNLSTRDTLNLPPSNSKPRLNPNRTHHSCFFFGFDPRANEYKVLNIHTIVTKQNHNRKPKNTHNCEILTVGTNSWRKIKMDHYKFSSYFRGTHMVHIQSICLHGCIHWVQNPDTGGKRRISVFDVRNEKFLPGIPFPSGASRDIKYPIEIGGKLALVHHFVNYICDGFRVWILEDYPNQVWESKRIQVFGDANRPRILTFGSSFSDNIYLIRGGNGNGVSFHLFCHDLNSDPNSWTRVEMQDLPEEVANVCCLERSGSSLYSNVVGSLNLLRFFITDMLDNIYPLKNGV